MAYAPGNHEGPNREDKGRLNGSCNVTACQLPNSAVWYNHSTRAYYCTSCALELNKTNSDYRQACGKDHDLCTSQLTPVELGRRLIADLATCDGELTFAREVLAGCWDARRDVERAIDRFIAIAQEARPACLVNQVLDVDGTNWLVRYAHTEGQARNEIAHARCTGSIGGSTTVNGILASDVVRLNADGTEAKAS